MSSDTIRQLSLLLFAEIKPFCVELTNISLLPDPLFKSRSVQLTSSLSKVQGTLDAHRKKYEKEVVRYQLSLNIADYVFYPLSNLLKKPTLSDEVITYILSILGFLLKYVWSFSPNQALISQLYPLTVFLMGGNTPNGLKIAASTLEFKTAGLLCIDQIVACLPRGFFSSNQDGQLTQKNLSLLGNTITLVLDILDGSVNPNSEEEIELANDCLSTLETLYMSYMTAEQLSHVLPGTVSKVVNFYIASKTLHYTIITNILKLLTSLITKVFSDESLQIELQDQANPESTLERLGELWEQSQEKEGEDSIDGLVLLPFNIPDSKNHRTNSWLQATSKQLKISLTILYKDLLIPSSNNKIKVQTKPQIEKEIVNFLNRLLGECFISLFNEFISLALDIFPLLIASISESRKLDFEMEKIDSFAQIVCLKGQKSETLDLLYYRKISYIYQSVFDKLEDLIKNRISSIMMSVDNERIRIFIISIKFQFTVLSQLSLILRRGEEDIFQLKIALSNLLQRELVRGFLHNDRKKRYDNKDILSILSGSGKSEVNQFDVKTEEGAMETEKHAENKFEDIELPPLIDASHIVKIKRNDTKSSINNFNTTNMILVSKQDWAHLEVDANVSYFSISYSASVEHQIIELIKFLGSPSSSSSLRFIEKILSKDIQDENSQTEAEIYLQRSVNLWFVNNLLTQVKSAKVDNAKIENSVAELQDGFNIDDFLDFGEKEGEATKDVFNDRSSQDQRDAEIENISYMVVGKSQDLIDEISTLLNNPESISTTSSTNSYQIYEMAYSVAIDSIGVLSNTLKLEDFQQDFLIDYLFPLLEALTFQSNPLIQSHAKLSLQQIVHNYYEGSLEAMIMDNLDYLVDCLSSKLSVVTSLTPSLAGILLVVLKISGINLLLTNQLLDVISEMFTLIDSYHGYSSLIEGFFLVFDEIVQQVDEYYGVGKLLTSTEVDESKNDSKYKPWGMTNINQLLKMINDSEKLVDPFKDYDSSKEYFKRKPNVPFAEQMEDSDDEDSNEVATNEANKVEEWKSPIPKILYEIVQRIFNYSFRLLTHPSVTLRYQILKMLTKVYPILSTDYNMVLPLVSKHWPMMMTLVVGTNSLSTDEGYDSYDTYLESAKLILPAIELTTVLIKEDRKRDEAFLGRKFLELWEFLTSKNEVFKGLGARESRKPSSTSVSKIVYNPDILSGYANLVITGLSLYERIIPDTTAYEMISFCWRCGIADETKFDHGMFTKEIKNTIWILKRRQNQETAV